MNLSYPAIWKILVIFLLHGSYQALEAGGFVHGQVSQYLTVQVDPLHLELVDELRVSQAFLTNSGVDPDDPQGPVFAFFEFTAYIPVLETFLQDVLGYGIYIFTFAVKTFGLFEDALPARFGCYRIY
jgi:hypothetical protein